MKVKLKEEWRKAEEEFYKIPRERRENYIFWTTMDFELGKEYEVLSEEKGKYRIVDESGEDYLYPADMFEIVEE